MPDLPLDARLLSDAIIELNISRHNVTLYPRDHPLVNKSLDNAFAHLNRLFELRDGITIAVAKDTIIIDEYSLDKKNPVYKDFAIHLNNMNIAYVTFSKGLQREELYLFHRFLLEGEKGMSPEELKERLKGYNIPHILIGFIDYSLFSIHDADHISKVKMWEWYVKGLIDGTIRVDKPPDELQEIPPALLAGLLNKAASDNLKEESYDKVIAAYLRRSSDTAVSGEEFKRLIEVIDGLKPDLKKRFLSTPALSDIREIEDIHTALGQIPIEKITGLLTFINKEGIDIPDGLRDLLVKLSRFNPEGSDIDDKLLVDDTLLKTGALSLIDSGRLDESDLSGYKESIQRLLAISPINPQQVERLSKEFNEDNIEKAFNDVILELLSSNIVQPEDMDYFSNILIEQIDRFISTAQYGQLLEGLKVLESIGQKDVILRPERLGLLIDSFRIMGRQNKEEAMQLIVYLGTPVIPHIIDALINEESQAVRAFFIELIVIFGKDATPHVIGYLKDTRWHVIRNMLYILTEIGDGEAVEHARPYADHENQKVALQALRYLLKVRDPYGIERLKAYLRRGDEETFREAIMLAGAFKVTDVVPELLKMLQKRIIRESDIYKKILIVRILGQIGDHSVIPTLQGILSSKSLFFRASLKRLKEEAGMVLKRLDRGQDERD